jgi:hypothetical protein
MRAICILSVTVTALASVLVPADARAGTTAPLSSLGVLPAPVPPRTPEATATVAGVVVKSKDGYGNTRWHDVNAATGRGYCLSASEGGYRWMSSWGTSAKGSASDLDLDRLVEKDGKATLERTRVHFEPSDATLTTKGRSQVELHEIARTPAGIVVWAFREGRDVVVLARGATSGIESRRTGADEAMFPFVSSDGCPFAGARLDARKAEGGSVAQLVGDLPPVGTGKDKVVPRFLVDASLSRVGRDPEPRIAVSVRIRDEAAR